MFKWKVSRYWNRFIYKIMRLLERMLWDVTGATKRDYEIIDSTAEDILTYIPKTASKGDITKG